MTPFAGFDAVLVAASQGGLPAFRRIAQALPADFPAPVLYAQHRAPGASDAVVKLLRRTSALEVLEGLDGAALGPGRIVVPAADAVVRITADRRLSLTPGHPGVTLADELFTSAAAVYGARVLAVVLTGRLRDGSAGVRAVKAAGGRVIAQDPEDAEQASMPWNAVATGCVDLVLDLPRIADALITLVAVPGGAELFGVRGGSWSHSASGR